MPRSQNTPVPEVAPGRRGRTRPTFTGYHFTTRDAYQKMLEHRSCLNPYPLDHLPLVASELEALRCTRKAVFLWDEIPQPASDLLGCVIDRVLAKHCFDIVLLRVTVPAHWVLGPDYKDPNGYTSTFLHEGGLSHSRRPDDPWLYHGPQGRRFALCTPPVPKNRFAKVAEFNLLRYVTTTISPALKTNRRT